MNEFGMAVKKYQCGHHPPLPPHPPGSVVTFLTLFCSFLHAFASKIANRRINAGNCININVCN